jgi:hypothetical protein
MDELILYLDKRDSKKAEAVEKFSFIIAGVTLLFSAYDSLMKPASSKSFIDILFLSFSSVAGLLNIIFAVIINKIKPETKKIKFYRSLLAASGLILIIDGVNKFMQHHQSIQYFLILAGFLYFSVALFYDDMQKRKYVKFNEEGISYRRSFLNNKTFSWENINSIQLDDKKFTLNFNDNKQYSFKVFPKGTESIADFKTRLGQEASKRNIKLVAI